MTTEDWRGINIKGGETTINNPIFNIGLSERAEQNSPHAIPYRGARNFVGRTAELATLHQELSKGNRVAICAIAGMGGVGKTELAIQYVQNQEAAYPGGICWLSARDTDLAVEILQFAGLKLGLDVPQEEQGQLLNLLQQVEWCWDNWKPPAERVLVVLDDVTDLGRCLQVLPRANRFRVLLTTRSRRLDANFFELSLDVLSAAEALDLLTALVGERRVGRERQVAEALCEWLGYLPLGLELVGRYLADPELSDPDLSLAAMLARLKAQRLQDEAIDRDEQQIGGTDSTAQRGVRAAFELSWQELDPMTQRVAQFLCLFASAAIPWELVKFATQSLEWREADINQAKRQLYKRYLLQQVEEGDGSYKIHPLIREFLGAKLAASEQADEFRQAFAAAMVTIAKQIPNSLTLEFIKGVKDTIPHLAEVAQNLTAYVREDLIWAFVGLGRFYKGQGLYALAEPWYLQCVSVVQTQLGNDHPDVATSFNNLAGLYESQGRYSEAEPLYQQALALNQRLLGNDHPAIATSFNNLAGLYESQGRYSEAEPLYQQALALRQRLLGNDHPDVAQSLNNLALLYKSQGRYSEAEPLYQQALALRQRLLGNDHPDVAASFNNLALLYKSQGRYSEAEPLYQQALALRQRLLGNDHPDVAQSLNNLASLYSSQGRYSEAEPLYQQALALRQRLLGNDHPDVATSLNNLAGLYSSQGRYSEAEPLLQQALALCQRLLGDDHPDVATSLNNLAALYYSQGRYSEAEPLYQQALALRQRLLGDDHPDVATSLNNLAALYHSQGRYSEAEPLYAQAVALSDRVLGANHPDTALFRRNLENLRDRRSSNDS